MTPHHIWRVAESPARIEAYDRRLAAIHEAGHAIMAAHLGYGAEAWVHRNETDDVQGERTWAGHMNMYGIPHDRGHPHLRMIAVAGMVAETLWQNGHDEEYAEPYIWEDIMIDGDSMSHSDWRLSNCARGEADHELHEIVAKVANLFMADLWSPIINASRTLTRDPDAVHSFQVARAA